MMTEEREWTRMMTRMTTIKKRRKVSALQCCCVLAWQEDKRIMNLKRKHSETHTMQRDGKPVEKVWRKMLKRRKFTIQNVNTNAGNISIWRGAWVSSGICQISILNEQIGCCDVSLLGNYAHTATLAVVTNHLLARSRENIEGKQKITLGVVLWCCAGSTIMSHKLDNHLKSALKFNFKIVSTILHSSSLTFILNTENHHSWSAHIRLPLPPRHADDGGCLS